MELHEARALGALGYCTASNGARALQLQASSGPSGREFASQTGISQNRLRYWRLRLAGAGDDASACAKGPTFHEVTVRSATQAVAVSSSVTGLRGVGPWRVQLRADFDAAALGRLLDVLESRC